MVTFALTEIPEIRPALSVSELNQQAKTLLERHFDQIRVEGEISDFTAASSGHWYFTLKDADAQIRCAMFRSANSRVRFQPTRGDCILVRGRISLYTNRGEFQLIVQHMQAAGDGALQQDFDKLKAKLKAQGLFDAERKHSIPNDARRVGVITSASGAALHDILAVVERRSPMTQILLFPVPVQGTEAAAALVAAVQQANKLHLNNAVPLDVLIIGRGGGSAEDLWAFNDEALAHAIAESNVPVVSAVGHEVDFSISDFVADYRAATPSAAAELVTLDAVEWNQRLDDAQRLLHILIGRRLSKASDILKHLRARLRHPGLHLTQQATLLAGQARQLRMLLTKRLDRDKTTVTHLAKRLQSRHPNHNMGALKASLESEKHRLRQRINQRLRGLGNQLAQQEQLIRTLGPENTLARGYAVVTRVDGKIIRSARETEPGSKIKVRLRRGSLTAEVATVSGPENDSDV